MVPWRFDISRAQDAMFDSPHKNDKCNVYIPSGEPGRQHIRWVGRVNFQKLDQQTALPKELTKNPIPKVVLQMILLFPRVGFVGSVEGVDIKETKTRSCDGFFVGHLERRRRYHHLRLYLDDGHHATLQCMAIRTDGPMLGESHDLKLGVFQICEYRTN